MSRFKVGDRVRAGGLDWSVEKVGTDGAYRVVSDDKETIKVYPESELELIAAADQPPTGVRNTSKYARKLYPLAGEPVMVDVYRVIDAFGVTDPAIQHAIKKLLMPGKRGAKGAVQDLEEAAFSIRQSVELMKQKGG